MCDWGLHAGVGGIYSLPCLSAWLALGRGPHGRAGVVGSCSRHWHGDITIIIQAVKMC